MGRSPGNPGLAAGEPRAATLAKGKRGIMLRTRQSVTFFYVLDVGQGADRQALSPLLVERNGDILL